MVACGQVYGDIVWIDSIDWGGATFPLWMLPSPGFGFPMCKCEEEADQKERGVHSFLSTLDHGWAVTLSSDCCHDFHKEVLDPRTVSSNKPFRPWICETIQDVPDGSYFKASTLY